MSAPAVSAHNASHPVTSEALASGAPAASPAAGGGAVGGAAAAGKVDISALLTARDSLQGVTVDLRTADAAMKLDVLEKVFDFRGDVTLTLQDGKVVTGYVFDRIKNASNADLSSVRLLPAEGEQRMVIGYGQIAQLTFGRDTALGKTFEAWIRKYVEKTRAGEKANIESEVL